MKSVNTILLRFSIFCIVLFVAIFGIFLWWKDAISPVDPQDARPVIFVVAKGDGVRSIATQLFAQNLIRSATGFYLIVKLMGIERDLQAGDFRLNKTMDAKSVAEELTHGILDVWVTTLEGWRVEEIATKLAKELSIPEREFLKYAKEGYMFPDTYLIPKDSTPAAIANIFLSTFDKKVTPKMREAAEKSGLPLEDVITLASIVEREGRSDSDRPTIAGILIKRLKAKMPLQVDATLQYVAGYDVNQKTWWRNDVTDDDKKVASPFNTYLHAGLPPAPIANPGFSSINAVIYPTESPYWYYIHDTEGVAHYAKTIEEHNANVAKYLQ